MSINTIILLDLKLHACIHTSATWTTFTLKEQLALTTKIYTTNIFKYNLTNASDNINQC